MKVEMFNRKEARLRTLESQMKALNTLAKQAVCQHEDMVFKEKCSQPIAFSGPPLAGYRFWRGRKECFWCGKVLQEYSIEEKWLEARLEYIKQKEG